MDARRRGRAGPSGTLGFMTAGSTHGEMAEGMPLVGRTGVFEELLEIVRSVRKGCVGSVVITGPSGSGKTAVLEVFLEHCRTVARGVRVLSAMGDEWEAQFPLAGYSQLMRTLPLRSAQDYDGGLASPVDPVAALTPAQVLDYASILTTHLEGLQSHGSVVVAVDDVHKLDVESLRILTFVMRRLHGKRIMFVLTFNPEETPRVPADVLDFLTSHQVARIPLDPLTPQQVQISPDGAWLDLSLTAARLVKHTGGLAQPIPELLRELPAETADVVSSLPPTSGCVPGCAVCSTPRPTAGLCSEAASVRAQRRPGRGFPGQRRGVRHGGTRRGTPRWAAGLVC
jgi:hypothetical protein